MSNDKKDEQKEDNKVIIMHGYDKEEIMRIMRGVKSMYKETGNLIFATSTENSLKMTLGDIIEDLEEDHEYMKNNPPVKK